MSDALSSSPRAERKHSRSRSRSPQRHSRSRSRSGGRDNGRNGSSAAAAAANGSGVGPGGRNMDRTCKVFVGNVDVGWSTYDLEDFFADVKATLRSVWVAKQPAGYGVSKHQRCALDCMQTFYVTHAISLLMHPLCSCYVAIALCV